MDSDHQPIQRVDQIQENLVLNLIVKGSQGDLQATDDLFAIISKRLDTYCDQRIKDWYGRWEGSWKDRDDLKQDTKLRILLELRKARSKFDSEEGFIAWAKTLARNICIDGWRRSNKEKMRRDTRPLEDLKNVSGTTLKVDTAADKWLSSLSEEDRLIVYLSVVEECNTREIVKILREKHNLRVSHSLVARHLKKALKSLRARFESNDL